MKRFEEYTYRQFKSLIKHLKKYSASREPETLHQIRVDIKKIKAVLSIIDESKKGFKAHKKFISLRDIFRKAGVIREPDVLIQLLLRYEVKGVDDTLLSGNQENLAAAFESEIPNFVKTVKSLRNNLEADIEHVHKDDLMRYMRRKKKEVKSQLYPRPKMRIIHKARKSIKEIVYLSEADGKLKKREAKFYDGLQNIIGEFHDKQVLLGILKKKNDDAGNDQYAVIKSECLADKKEINRLVNDFYGK